MNKELTMEKTSLPAGWKMKKLIELGEVQTGTTPSTSNKDFYGDFIPFVKPPHFNPDGTISFSSSGLSEIGLAKGRLIKGNSILMVCIGASIGKTGITPIPISCNQQINAFSPNENCLPKFYYHLLSSDYFFRKVMKRSSQATLPMINKTKWQNIEIPLPPLTQQIQIVALLDKAFAAIATAKANAEQNLQNAKELFESYLQNVFSTKGDDWESCELNDFVNFIDYRGRTPVKTSSGVRLITAKNIKLGYLQQKPEEFIATDNYESWMTRGIPNFGDIIFTTEAPLGNIAQVNTKEKIAFAQRVIVMQPDPSKINQTFLKYLLLSNPIRNKILAQATGATVLGIKSRLLKKIGIDFPKSIKEQQKIVEGLDSLSTETKKLEAIYTQKLADLEELKKSVLQKAFSGQLTVVND